MEGLEAVVEAGRHTAEPQKAKGHDYAIVPPGCQLEDLQGFQDKPRRVQQVVVLHDEASFCSYVETFNTKASRIFADPEGCLFICVFDYHTSEGAAFCQHRAHYPLPKSREWQTWRAKSGHAMSQVNFAQFVEENQIDIRTPPGARILEVARSLQAKRSVQFISAVRLQTGDQEFTYNESTEGTVGKGKVAVPEEFKLGIPVFFGGAKYDVTARLRYRLDDGKLQLWYELYRPEYIEQDAFSQIVASVRKMTGISPLLGKL